MSQFAEFARTGKVPQEELKKLSERMVLNRNSDLYTNVVAAVGERYRQLRSNMSKTGKTKPRAYVTQVLKPMEKHAIQSEFPNFSVNFLDREPASAAAYQASRTMMHEYLLSLTRVRDGKVVAYGFDLMPILMRSRTWMHLCVSGNFPHAQARFLKEDAQVDAVVMSLQGRRARMPQAMQQYVEAEERLHCASAANCRYKAPIGVADLCGVNTSFRQFAYWMSRHDMRQALFFVPGDKNMELGTDGRYPEFGSYVVHKDGLVKLLHPGDTANQYTNSYDGYLELVARTRVTIGAKTYHKEFVARLGGFLVYKVTTLPGVIDEPMVPYKSWVYPDFRNCYMVYFPILKPGHDADKPSSWHLQSETVPKPVIDDVVEYAMSVSDDRDCAKLIERRLNSKVSNYLIAGQIHRNAENMDPQLFCSLALVIYVKVYMTKYEHGTTVQTFAPIAREMGRLSERAFPRITASIRNKMMQVMLAPVTKLKALLRSYYEAVTSIDDLPMPSFVPCPGFVEYSDDENSNPKFTGWKKLIDPLDGFTKALPVPYVPDRYRVTEQQLKTAENFDALKSWGGNWNVGRARAASVSTDAFTDLSSDFIEFHDAEEFADGEKLKPPTLYYTPQYVNLELPRAATGYVDEPLRSQPYSVTEEADELAKKIAASTVPLPKHKPRLTQLVPWTSPDIPTARGKISDNPVADLLQALRKWFPDTFLINTHYFEDERNKVGFDLPVSATRLAVDVSKISAAKHMSVYLPRLRGHVAPNYQTTTINVLRTLIKRNADTPYNMLPSGVESLYNVARAAIFKVYYREGAEEWLKAQEYIGPDESTAREWVGKHDLAKTVKLVESKRTFSFDDLMLGTTKASLMLKGKAKPNTGTDYATAVKFPQTVQFDQSGMHVPIIATIVGSKVSREKHMLKGNVLIMQGKSPDDISRFLSAFSWHPTEKGQLWYIELDSIMFDKSQVAEIAQLYLKRLKEFKVLPQYVQYVNKDTYHRTCSCVAAGVMIQIDDQNASGYGYTLDRNDDTTKMMVAELLLPFSEAGSIEFIIQQGDDFTVAIRSHTPPDVIHWEREMSDKFNMNVKVQVQQVGSVVGYDIVHLPGGHLDIQRDLLREALSLMTMDLKDRDDLHEKWISCGDRLRRVGDAYIQQCEAAALPKRYTKDFPMVDGEAVTQLMSAFAKMKEDYASFESFFSTQKTIR